MPKRVALGSIPISRKVSDEAIVRTLSPCIDIALVMVANLAPTWGRRPSTSRVIDRLPDMRETPMKQLERRELMRGGAAVAALSALPGLGHATDQSTLSGAGQRSIERYLTLQEARRSGTGRRGPCGRTIQNDTLDTPFPTMRRHPGRRIALAIRRSGTQWTTAPSRLSSRRRSGGRRQMSPSWPRSRPWALQPARAGLRPG